ncbi:hypothetical protein AZOA_26180 [Azoarcus sp. Aa7]|nr:hypothetical protein [Azoarcus sp. Aa7]
MRFALPQGYSHDDEFFEYLRDAFDVMDAEGDERPAMMSVGMHCRLLGRPGRFRALQRVLNHIEKHDRVWVCRRVDIAGTGANSIRTARLLDGRGENLASSCAGGRIARCAGAAVEELEVAAPALFGGVHGDVGMPDQFVYVLAVLREDADADAR